MTIILFGIFWGFIEATLGGLLHAIRFPMTGSIMAPIGFAILFMASRRKASGAQLVTISAIAASFKFFDIFLFGLSPFQLAIVNPAQAILLQGLSFTAFAWLVKAPSPVKKLLGATAMTATSVVLFNLTGHFIAGQAGVPLFTNQLTVSILHTLAAIVATYLLIGLASKIDQVSIETFTLGNASFAMRAVTGAILVVTALAVHKWLI